MARSALAKAEKRAERPPLERLMRVTPFAVRDAAEAGDGVDDGLTLDGYAAVFNRETLIDSWEGRFWEACAPGSMRKSFRETTPRLQFDHGRHPMIGSIPIGSIRSLAEESDPERAPDGGAHVVARLFDNWLIQPVRDAVAEQAINGMSFRFTVVREEWREPDGRVLRDQDELYQRLMESWLRDVPEDELLHRTLKEVKVPELGPVVWPAYEQTSVDVRAGRVVIDLAAARSGDPDERRKLAEALYLADADPEENPHSEVEGEGIVSSTARTEPAPTARKAAGDHSEVQPHDAPAPTAPAAGSHPSQRRTEDVRLDRVRSRLLAIPSQPPRRAHLSRHPSFRMKGSRYAREEDHPPRARRSGSVLRWPRRHRRWWCTVRR